MGEVYRAHDTKLNRDVAIKILPELFATDVDRHTHLRVVRRAETPRAAETLTLQMLPTAAFCAMQYLQRSRTLRKISQSFRSALSSHGTM